MKNIIFCLAIIFMARMGYAQTKEFRMHAPDKPIILRMDQASVDVVGYDGDEIVIKNIPDPGTDTVRGLKQLPLYGRTGNDTITPKVVEKENALFISTPLGNFRHLQVQVPKKSMVQFIAFNSVNNSRYTVSHIDEAEILGIINDIEVNDVAYFLISSGGSHAGRRPSDKIVLSNIRWSAQPRIFNGQPVPRTYIVGAGSASVTVMVPDTLKANIFFSTRNGRTFSNLNATPPDVATDQAMIHEFPLDDTNVRYVSQNGGGVNICVNNDYGNIYFKKEGK